MCTLFSDKYGADRAQCRSSCLFSTFSEQKKLMQVTAVKTTVTLESINSVSVTLYFGTHLCQSELSGTQLFYSEYAIAADISYTTANGYPFGRIFVDIDRLNTRHFTIWGLRRASRVLLKGEIQCLRDETSAPRTLSLFQIINM